MSNRSLRKTKTLSALFKLNRDNFSHGDFWLGADCKTVWIVEQAIGEKPEQRIVIPKKHFNYLIDKYNKVQTSAPKKSKRK